MRFCVYFICGLAVFLFSGRVFAQANVEGKVELPRQSPGMAMSQRYQSGGEVQTAPPDPPLAVVYLEGEFKTTTPPPSAEMAQKNISFAPGLLPIRVGTTVSFPNMDDTYHNVFSYSRTKRFDLGRYRKDEKPAAVLFDKSGVVTLHCEVHGTMRGTILVLETPYFQKTDAGGQYRLRDLPVGHYVLKAWLNENDVRTSDVDLKAGQTLHVDFPAK